MVRGARRGEWCLQAPGGYALWGIEAMGYVQTMRKL